MYYHMYMYYSINSDNFMHGLYRIFIGDARPSAEKDEWIFHSIESIQDIVIPAARIALKVHQVSNAATIIVLWFH